MKRFGLIIVLIAMLMATGTLFAQQTAVGFDDQKTHPARIDRDPPEFSVITSPVDIITNFYDYMPGSYQGAPLHVQPATTGSGGDSGGLYVSFHAEETGSATRRVYWAYINEAGSVTNYGYTGSQDLKEGYPGVAIDPWSTNPFIAYHIDFEGDEKLEIVLTSDSYALLGQPGLWNTIVPVIDDDIPACAAAYPRSDNYYAWPYVHTGPSPLGPPYRRLYIIASNNKEHEEQYASGNPFIAYCDYDSQQSSYDVANFEWSYTSIPDLDAYDSADPTYGQCNNTLNVSQTDGTLVLMGYGNMAQNAYVAVNTNYGEGDWEFYSTEIHNYVDNPQNQHGDYTFLDGDTPYDNLEFTFTRTSHFNSLRRGDDVMFPCHFALRSNQEDDSFNWWYSLVFPKVMHFNLASHEFTFQDLYPTGLDQNDNNVMLPWDLDEDGTVDEFDPDDGDVLMAGGWPIYHWDESNAGHDNNYKMVGNEEYGWLAIIWQEGLKCRYANDGVEGYESWEAMPEIKICISRNNGLTWSEPMVLDANPDDEDGGYVPELDGMIPEYVYGGDLIEYLYTETEEPYDVHGKLHLFFLDDNSYGSSNNDVGPDDGGMMKYMALDVNFGPREAAGPDDEVPHAPMLSQNSPNPFNPETAISFSLPVHGDVRLDVYNVRGQRVKTLYNGTAVAGDHTVIWRGLDENGAQAASGVYFYRLQANGVQETRKMLLLK